MQIQYLRIKNFKLIRDLEIKNIESALILAKAGLGYTIYPDIPGAREPGLRYIPVESLPTVSFGVYYPQAEGHPVLKRFLKILGEGMPASSSP